MNKFNPDYIVTVGEILREEYLTSYNLSTEEFASGIRITVTRANKILNGEELIDFDIALRLSKFFHTTPSFWMNLQMLCDDRRLRNDPDHQEIMESIKPLNM